ncbi:MAG: hypothetical protein KAT90_01970 [Gammaproteobacteria bacterium]|nr:hypothetical protein [Gammaproteobacteria bacterium]
MKNITVTALLAVNMLLPFGSVHSAADNEKFLNGKPFAYVNEAIQANADAIAANSTGIEANASSITQIETDVSTLQTDLDGLSVELDALLVQVNENVGVINDLLASDIELQDAINLNSNLLSDLRIRHNLDVAALNSRIGDVEGDIIALQQYVNIQVLQINSVITDLQTHQAGIDAAQDAAISDLQTKALGLMSSVMSINATLSSHSTSLSFLEGRMNSFDTQLNSLGARLSSLEESVATLECLPGHPEDPCSVKITVEGEAYGHHGACSGWNGCGDAGTCAQWACEVNGYSEVVSWGEDKPCTQFNNCHLFYSRGSVDRDWGNGCSVQGVTDIACK